ncbi:MAG: T9SS type A sorting domain-containing protein, partial [Bacteroidales bacterium]|nr:T9SS type A sorting domain-containing protein [Bacteroidales bacterium]
FIFKTDKSGNILHQQMGNYPNFTGWLNYNLLENFEGNGYLLFSQYQVGKFVPLALNINPDLSVKSSGHIKLPDSLQFGNLTTSMWDYYDVTKFNDKIVFIARAGLDPEDFYLTKIDTNGNILEMVLDEGEHEYYLHGGINTLDYKNDHIYVSYQDSGRSGVDFPSYTNKIIVRKADTSLNILWEKRLGWDAYYWHSDIYAIDDGGCLVLASVYDADTMFYQNDIVLFKLDSNGNVTGTHRIEDAGGQSLRTYPNPGEDYFNLDMPIGKGTLQVFNQNGQLLFKQPLTKGRNKIDMKPYASGIYYLRLTNEQNRNVGAGKWIKR